MELTEEELILHTRKRDAVKWPYLCLRRYGYDSNLFSFESGRRCQTGQGETLLLTVRLIQVALLVSFKFILHPSSLKGYSRSSAHGLRRSLTCCRTSCTTTASVLWRSQCWSLSFQWRHTRPPVRTDTLAAFTFILGSLTNSSIALSTAPGYAVPTVANGIGRYPSFGDASSRPSSRHPSVGSTRLPSVGEESTHPLLLNDETVHKNIG